MTTPTLTRIDTGRYETTYRGRQIELISLARYYDDTGWIAPIDGENDIEPRATRREVLDAAIRSIDVQAEQA